MAVKELRDYIENGNIRNSVNYPACDMGVCTNAGRIAVCHKNIPSVISNITAVLGAAGVNISDMLNKSRNDYAYSLFDLDDAVNADVIKKLEEVEGVIKVRVVK